ncbi:MAG: carbamoyltransferase [Bacteriovoracaceae bacterium]|nr:carbamoyltransferase [Bacteriovoracaceae bacterium]
MKVLGLSAFFHDSAAALIDDGKIVSALQEERFSRLKHDHRFPKNAVDKCFELSQIESLDELDGIVYYEKPFLTFERLVQTHMDNAPYSLSSFLAGMPIWLQQKLYLKGKLKKYMRKNYSHQGKLPEFWFVEHHHAHASAAFYPSPYKKAAVLCLDGVGEWATTSAWIGEDNSLKPLFEIQFPHSLGLLYSAFTQYLGFKVNNGEYKLMGLSSYGEPKYVDLIKENLIDIKNDGSFRLNLEYFNFHRGLTMINKKFEQLFGIPKNKSEENFSKEQMDIAASIQAVTEEVVFKLADEIHKQTGLDSLCLAGGVALNCVANGKLLKRGPFKNIWIQPAAGDAGSAIGSALIAWHEIAGNKRDTSTQKDQMRGAYLGNSYSEENIPKELIQDAEKLSGEALLDKVTDLMIEGKVIGWFQGRMEFGPRALGSRSIIADARNTEMQRKLNLKIKKRESFRPFAASLLAEDAKIFYEEGYESPYMLLVENVNPAIRKKQDEKEATTLDINNIRSSIPAVTHIDFSCRTQTVSGDYNPKYRKLIEVFKRKTGTGLIVNTSFNVKGEPIVESPEDAIQCFKNTEMDALVIENYLFIKDAKNKEMKDSYVKKSDSQDLFPTSHKPVSIWQALGLTFGLTVCFMINQVPPGSIYLTLVMPLALYFTEGGKLALSFIFGLIVKILDIVFLFLLRVVLTLFYFFILSPWSIFYRLIKKPTLFFPFKLNNESYIIKKIKNNTNWSKPF